MVVIPAIDLYQGKVVRMIKGNKDKTMFYNHNPLELLKKFLNSGFKLIHIVDLSKAIDNSRDNFKILEKFAENGYSKYIQIGGGIRSLDYALELKELGFKRQIMTSVLVKNVNVVSKLVEQGIDVVFGLDTHTKDSLAISGWKDFKEMDIFSFLILLKKLGLREVIHTDISVDGTLRGRDLSLTIEITKKTALQTIVAGGIASTKDLEKIKETSKKYPLLKGVIVGRAFFEGFVSLKEMMEYAC